MAEKRMFSQRVIDSDAFLDMPLTAQALYFHLSMRADDDGFLDNPRKIQRVIGASADDLRLLMAKRYLILSGNRRTYVAAGMAWAIALACLER